MPTIAPERQIHANLQIGRPDGITWTDVSDYLSSATVELGNIENVGTGQSGVDGVVRRASFTLHNDRAAIPGDSFSPRDRDSAWNQFDVDGDGTPEYAPLLWPNREVVLRVAVTGEPGQGTTTVMGEQAVPVPGYNTVTGETPTFLYTIPWDYGVQSESPSQSGIETIYYWDDSINRDETYVIGNDTDALGDETDSAVPFIESLFGVAASTREAPVYVTAHTSLVPGTVTVYLDGTPTAHVEIDYVAGEIVVLDENWTTQSVVTVDYTYTGTASVYQLANDDVVPGSETVYYDGVPTTDYSIDYAAGTITLYVDAASGTVTVDYQYITYDYQRYDVPHVDLMPDTVTVYVNGEPASGYSLDLGLGRITFEAPLSPSDVVTADYVYWVTLFHGLLGDSIRTSGPTVECDARDLAKRLQDAYILTVREYGSEAGTPAEDVIQQIIDDNLGAGEVTLYFPSGTASDPRPVSESPGFMVTPYVVEYMSVWDAIQQVAAQFGWFLGYRWHPNTGRMQLILMEPPRNKDATTADFALSWEDDIYTQDLEITDRDIRNVVTVTYRNSATGDRESVTVQDADSIATYGPRAMQIEEGDASLIDTPEEAQRLANAALADLKDMTATTQLNLPLLPTLDVFSGIVVTDPRLSSTDDFYGVESVRHVLDFEARQFRTEVIAGGRVVGGHHRWLRMQTRPGANAPPSPERVVGGGRVLPKPVGVVARGILRGVALDVPVPPVNVNRWAATEVHVSATQGFTPSDATRVASGRETHFEVTSGLVAGTTYYLRAFYVDVKGNKSLASDEVSAVAGEVGGRDIAPVFLFCTADDMSGTVINESIWNISTTGTTFVDGDVNFTSLVADPGATFEIMAYRGSTLGRGVFDSEVRWAISAPVPFSVGIKGGPALYPNGVAPEAYVTLGTNANTIKFVTFEQGDLSPEITDNIPFNFFQFNTTTIQVRESECKLLVNGELVATHTSKLPTHGVVRIRIETPAGNPFFESLDIDYVLQRYL